jgi:ElaB/YqjD/DUF883 family membrane-anchored ribosome-binding protein
MVDTNAAAAKAREAVEQGVETAREYAGAAREYADSAREYARDYAEKGLDAAGRVSENLQEFVRQEPWIAVAAAFAVGYLMARILRRVSA